MFRFLSAEGSPFSFNPTRCVKTAGFVWAYFRPIVLVVNDVSIPRELAYLQRLVVVISSPYLLLT